MDGAFKTLNTHILFLITLVCLTLAPALAACRAGLPFPFSSTLEPGASGEAPQLSVRFVTQTPAPPQAVSVIPSPTPQRDTEFNYSTIDRLDDLPGYQIHFIYALPSDGTDRMLDINGRIQTSAIAANNWLAAQSGGSRFRYDTFRGDLDITFMRLPYSAAELNELGQFVVDGFDQILRDAGFEVGHKLYVVYYDGLFVLEPEGLACGQAIRPPESYGLTAAIYLRGYSPEFDALSCPALSRTPEYAGWIELVLAHEIFHLLGAVPDCAPNFAEAHVSDHDRDLMSSAFTYDFAASSLLDFNNDDYFNHQIPDCPDIANSVFLQPSAESAEKPPAWEQSTGPRLFDPFEISPAE